jgi:hypothetical protein
MIGTAPEIPRLRDTDSGVAIITQSYRKQQTLPPQREVASKI